MAGVILHLATLGKEDLPNPECVIGANFPDIAKKAFNECKTGEQRTQYLKYCIGEFDISRLLSFNDFLTYCRMSHFMDDPKKTDRPILLRFVNSPFVNLEKPFWRAVAKHLIGDLLFYDVNSQCVNREKFQSALDRAKNRGEEAVNKFWEQWYREYDCINLKVIEELKKRDNIDIMRYVTPEMQEKFSVGFVEGDTEWQNWKGIKEWIYRVREVTKNLKTKDDMLNIINALNERESQGQNQIR